MSRIAAFCCVVGLVVAQPLRASAQATDSVADQLPLGALAGGRECRVLPVPHPSAHGRRNGYKCELLAMMGCAKR